MPTLLRAGRAGTVPAAPQSSTRSIRGSLGVVVLLALGSRALVVLISVFSVALAEPETISPYATGKPLMAWDSVHYHTITVQGYPDTQSPLIAFFPFYPLLARSLTAFVPADIALLAVSNGATVLAALFIFLWASAFAEPRTAVLCTALTLAYPPALFCSAAYTEGLFLLLTALTLWLLHRQSIWSAASLSGFTTGLRPTGVALAAVVLWYGL